MLFCKCALSLSLSAWAILEVAPRFKWFSAAWRRGWSSLSNIIERIKYFKHQTLTLRKGHRGLTLAVALVSAQSRPPGRGSMGTPPLVGARLSWICRRRTPGRAVRGRRRSPVLVVARIYNKEHRRGPAWPGCARCRVSARPDERTHGWHRSSFTPCAAILISVGSPALTASPSLSLSLACVCASGMKMWARVTEAAIDRVFVRPKYALARSMKIKGWHHFGSARGPSWEKKRTKSWACSLDSSMWGGLGCAVL
jgi:hypothetical protein